ncbi:MAG: hypothetical protein DIU70_006455 [Bacillota bacterium]|nr:MAG: hypothetical protein DIU70_01550 [Bacillota bacterium]
MVKYAEPYRPRPEVARPRRKRQLHRRLAAFLLKAILVGGPIWFTYAMARVEQMRMMRAALEALGW